MYPVFLWFLLLKRLPDLLDALAEGFEDVVGLEFAGHLRMGNNCYLK